MITLQQLYDFFSQWLKILPYGLAFFIILNYTLEVMKGIVDRILGAPKKQDVVLKNIRVHEIGEGLVFESRSNFVPQKGEIVKYKNSFFKVEGFHFQEIDGEIVLNLFVKEK